MPLNIINDKPNENEASVIKDNSSNKPALVIQAKRRVKAPKSGVTIRPPRSKGYIWQIHGNGWDCRRDERINGKGPRPYIGHLSKPEFQKIKSDNKSEAALIRALENWISEKENMKGIKNGRSRI